MVKKLLLSACFLAFFLCSPGYSSEYKKNLIKEIEDTFAEDILSSSEVYKKRKYYRKYPYKFESGPAKLFLFHSEPELTLKTIIGQENFQKIPSHFRLKIIESLTNTFRRYAYEWLNSNLNTSLRLKKISLIDEKNAILIVERNMKVVPNLDLKLFVNKTGMGWKVFDFGFWDFRYTRMKRGNYIKFFNTKDFKGLILMLQNKNNKFFKKNIVYQPLTP